MVLDAVGNPQTILLLGGTSEIGLAICERYLKNAHARIVLAAMPNDPGRDDAGERGVDIGTGGALPSHTFRRGETARGNRDAFVVNGRRTLDLLGNVLLGFLEGQCRVSRVAFHIGNIGFQRVNRLFLGRRLGRSGISLGLGLRCCGLALIDALLQLLDLLITALQLVAQLLDLLLLSVDRLL